MVVGSGFGSLFYLKRHLALRPRDRVLILEWGGYKSLDEQSADGRNSDLPRNRTYRNLGEKDWNFTIGLGGGTNCWWALTPRLHPSDFKLQTLYGVGVDWPLDYDELESYYLEAETIMSVAGSNDLAAEYPRSGPYPQPAHHLTTVDEMLSAAPGSKHYAIPSARLSRPLNDRGRCCSAAMCNLCPTGAKFFALNGMQDVLSHPQVSICLNAKVERFDHANGAVTAAVFSSNGAETIASGDLFILGAGAIHAPFILQRSGIGGAGLGRYLGEKIYAFAEAHLDGLAHFDGGTVTTGFNVSLLDGAHRSERGAATILIENAFDQFGLRAESGRWREVVPIGIFVEDLLSEENGVFDEGGDVPVVRHSGYSDYARRGLDAALSALPGLLEPLPVETVKFRSAAATASHVQGSVRFGRSPEDSVVDVDHVHHSLRNLLVVGTSVFPTTGSLNPSLTCAAMSLRAADRLLRNVEPA